MTVLMMHTTDSDEVNGRNVADYRVFQLFKLVHQITYDCITSWAALVELCSNQNHMPEKQLCGFKIALYAPPATCKSVRFWWFTCTHTFMSLFE